MTIITVLVVIGLWFWLVSSVEKRGSRKKDTPPVAAPDKPVADDCADS